MGDIKISVIVPIYNMEKYIFTAVESFEKQTLEDKEILLIDDGSTDSSYEIMQRCAEQYSNVSILQQDNAGSGTARNLGMKYAKGEFVAFLDSDDFYASDDALEFLYRLAKQKKVPVCGGSSCNVVEDKFSIKGLRKERVFAQNGYIAKEDYPGMTGYLAFIFETAFLKKNNIFFPNYLRGQDAPFFIKAIACAGGAYCSSKIVYAYRVHHKVVKFDERKAIGLLSSYRDIAQIALEYNMPRIQRIVCEESKGELGALAYKYSYLGSVGMNKIVVEMNQLLKGDIVKPYKEKNGKLFLEGEDIKQYMTKIQQEKIQFIDKLQKTNKVFIFGAGVIGRKVALFLRENGVRIEAFLVSDLNDNPSEVYGIPIKKVGEHICEDISYLVIIATFWYSQAEIEKLLLCNEMRNIHKLDVRKFMLWLDVIEH